jgi:putative DNA primase/helicase
MLIDEIATHFEVEKKGNGYQGRCSAHESKSGNSLAISIGDNGNVVLHCFAGCTTEAIVASGGLSMSDLFQHSNGQHVTNGHAKRSAATIMRQRFETAQAAIDSLNRIGRPTKSHTYRDPNGQGYAVTNRFDLPDGKKEFRPVSLHDGGWYVKGPKERLLYQVDTLADAVTIYVCEGEGCADAARSIGLDSTTSMGGAQAPQKTDWSPVAGKDVVILRDNDEPGRKYAAAVTKLCVKAGAKSVKTILLPGLPIGGDIVEWIDNHGDAAEPVSMRQEIEAMVAEEPAELIEDHEPAESLANEGKPSNANEAVDDPHRLARLFLLRYTDRDGLQRIVFWQGCYWLWDGLRYTELKRHEVIAALTACIKAEFDRANVAEQKTWSPKKEYELPPKARPVTKGLLNNVENALASLVVRADSITMPEWLTSDIPFPAREILPTAKRLIHLPSLLIGEHTGIAPTPMFFSCNSLEYNFDHLAVCPKWLAFLQSLWPNDPDSIGCLQEWFGYLLLPDTRQHKLLMLIGPPRSGKGTITRVLRSLLGAGNIASPTLSSLAGPFGLWPLLNKNVALIPDARLSGRDDHVAVVERLLSVAGEDPQDIHRKNLPTLTAVRMPVRFVLMSNELPNMKDASGAFMTRVVLLRMTETFFGREDKKLGEKLAGELPGILNWSIEGWRRLNQRGYFEQPQSATEMLQDLENLSSPVKQFIADACHIGAGCEASVDALYRAWTKWCDENHREHKGTIQTLGRDLRAALPNITGGQRRSELGRERFYEGIGIRLDW